MMDLVFVPLVPVWAIAGVAGLAVMCLAVALWRRASGWALQALALGAGVAALTGPSVRQMDSVPLPDVIVAVVDRSASQSLSQRPDQTGAAVAHLRRLAAMRPQTELRVVDVGDDPNDGGTLAMAALRGALADVPQDQLAAAVLITDGQVHDADLAPGLTVPFNVLLTGGAGDWDRRLIVSRVPAFGIVGEEVPITLRVEDDGAAPDVTTAQVALSFDGGKPFTFQVPIGEQVQLPLPLPHGGQNILRLSTPPIQGELTDRNNASVLHVNGVRDRLRVMLVTGSPHAGARTWRNLLKSDANVDLAHFTILRPPSSTDFVPVEELSLIPFPTRELFVEKINEFDLIIFDRYPLRGILPLSHLEQLRAYTDRGGAVLVSAGPDFAGAQSLFRSPVGDIMPGAPSGRVVERAFLPRLTEQGLRHPVTRDLPQGGEDPTWGHWLRQVDITATRGTTVMTGADDRPLLVLDRFGEGRVALLASDHVWLWDRGFEGGGPQMELLRRLAHWLMKEPELEEDTLIAQAQDGVVTVTRRTLSDTVDPATVTLPDGTTRQTDWSLVAPGVFTARIDAPMQGLYRVQAGDLQAVAVMGPPAPREFESTIASGAILEPIAQATGGGVLRIEAGLPQLREVRAGRQAHGRNWIGMILQRAERVTDLRVTPVLPDWAWMLVIAGLAMAAWIWAGRTRRA